MLANLDTLSRGIPPSLPLPGARNLSGKVRAGFWAPRKPRGHPKHFHRRGM